MRIFAGCFRPIILSVCHICGCFRIIPLYVAVLSSCIGIISFTMCCLSGRCCPIPLSMGIFIGCGCPCSSFCVCPLAACNIIFALRVSVLTSCLGLISLGMAIVTIRHRIIPFCKTVITKCFYIQSQCHTLHSGKCSIFSSPADFCICCQKMAVIFQFARFGRDFGIFYFLCGMNSVISCFNYLGFSICYMVIKI